MIKTNLINEINNSYLEVINDENICEDYRIKMLKENNLPCFLLKTVRHINGNTKEYYDISGKESLLSFFNLRVADRNELSRLFLAMSQAAEEAEKLLIEEGNIIFRPDCIFINSLTMSYEFICIPVKDPEYSLRENVQSLLQFFLSKLDENDIPLLKTIYSLFDRHQTSALGSRHLYEVFLEGINRDDSSKTETIKAESGGDIEKTDSTEDKNIGFFPSFKDILMLFLIVTGTILIGYESYFIMLTNQ